MQRGGGENQELMLYIPILSHTLEGAWVMGMRGLGASSNLHPAMDFALIVVDVFLISDFCFIKDNKKGSFSSPFPLFFHSQKVLPRTVPDCIPKLPSSCHWGRKLLFSALVCSLLQ